METQTTDKHIQMECTRKYSMTGKYQSSKQKP